MPNYNKNEPRLFHGRLSELDDLERAFRSERSELWVVYGRRRIGKTELLLRFAEGKKTFFFTGGRENRKGQTRRFLADLAAFTNQPMLRKVRDATWNDALSALDQYLATVSSKVLVILDEFQWMCQGSLAPLSELQRLWDHGWKGSGRIHLVLCGSAESFMTGEVLARKSPLFGRRTASLRLGPLSAAEAREFFPRRSLFEVTEALMCVGGVPAYLERLVEAANVRRGLNDLAFVTNGYLAEEADLVFGEQLRDKERYYEIARLLSSGPASLADLARATELNKGQLSFYLQRLVALGFVDKHRPITKSPSSKTLRYRLRDEYLRFFFTFVEPNKAKINLRARGYQFDRITAASWEPFIGLAFEQFVSRNVRAVLSVLGAIDVVGRIGTYWHRTTKARQGVQIDLVIERDDGVTNLVECKWSRKPVGRAILEELSQKKALYPNPKSHTLEPVIVAAAGASKPVRSSGTPVITLEDLFAPPHDPQ